MAQEELKPTASAATDEAADRKGTRTEVTTREFDAEGNLTAEIVLTTVKFNMAEDKPWPGQYL